MTVNGEVSGDEWGYSSGFSFRFRNSQRFASIIAYPRRCCDYNYWDLIWIERCNGGTSGDPSVSAKGSALAETIGPIPLITHNHTHISFVVPEGQGV